MPTTACIERRLRLDLIVVSLHVLGRDNGVVVDSALLGADVGLSVRVELATLVEVEVDGVGPSDCEEDKGDAHGVAGTNAVSDVAENDGADGTTADGGDQEGSSALGVAAETTESKGED
jgi:hypothetical protein